MSPITDSLLAGFALTVLSTTVVAAPVDDLLTSYRQQGATNFSASAGKTFWNQSMRPAGSNSERSCASCHTSDLRQPGKHAVTGKEIKPLAPSVMSIRLTNPAKIKKWLKRNCEWTRGRECTPQEKADVLTYLRDL
ncbi:MAG: DUF1924 domain-containing protein [Gammaproteobacteria bacterium]|nr:DUF1924 domain-containing protein [Gammaproteobacteria bacterium]